MASARGGPAQPGDRREVPVPKASRFSPYPVPRTECPTGAFWEPRRIPGPPCQRLKCHLVALGPEGQAGVPSPWQRALPCPARPSQPLSPLLHRLPRHHPTAPFPTSVSPPPPISTSLLSPIVSRPPCPYTLPFLHAGSGLWPPPLGLSHRAAGSKGRRCKAAEGLISSQAHKAGKWLWYGAVCPVHSPECLCCHPCALPKVTLAASPALELHRSCSRPPAAPQRWLRWDLVCGRSHEGAPGTHQRWGRNARSRACFSCRAEERC